jgi:hypothetical protein
MKGGFLPERDIQKKKSLHQMLKKLKRIFLENGAEF